MLRELPQVGRGQTAFEGGVGEAGDGQFRRRIRVANPLRTADRPGDSERDEIAT
jgi:hypothetical protein